MSPSRGGPSKPSKRRRQPSVSNTRPYRATGKKSLGAYALRDHCGDRTSAAWSGGTGETVSAGCGGEPPELFAAIATGDDRLWVGPCLWPSAEEVAGTLWDSDRGQYGAQGDRRAWRVHARATGTGSVASQHAGLCPTNWGTRWVDGANCDARYRREG